MVIVTKLVFCTRIVRGQREGHEEWTARRQREERTATMVDTKKGSIYIKRAFLIKRVVFKLKGSSLIERIVFN